MTAAAMLSRSGVSKRGLFTHCILLCCSASVLAVVSAMASILACTDLSASNRKRAEIAAKHKAATAVTRSVRRNLRSLLANLLLANVHIMGCLAVGAAAAPRRPARPLAH